MNISIDKDLRGLFGPARDQDPRPTCMAFAASDAHAGARPGWKPLSVEWAHYHALKREGAQPHEGVSLEAMLATLRDDGQPIETAWPYITSIAVDMVNYRPPPTSSPIYRRDSTSIPRSVDEIVKQLDLGQPVLFTMSISNSFFNVPEDGVITATEPIELRRVHALVAVGHGHAEANRFLLVRNSWGDQWALNGYVWLDFTYLEPRLLTAAILTGEL